MINFESFVSDEVLGPFKYSFNNSVEKEGVSLVVREQGGKRKCTFWILIRSKF